MSWLILFARRLFSGLLALVILFEEWGWEPLQRALAGLSRWRAIAWLEQRIAALSPRWALVLLGVPFLLLQPFQLTAIWLVSQGQAKLGLMMLLGAKIFGTALLARLFHLTHPALMRMPWFERGYTRWSGWKNALLAKVRASWAWRAGRVFKRQALRRWQAIKTRFSSGSSNP